MTYSFTHTTQIRVRYGETDQMGYVYYGNYAQYFEVGRVETLRTLGMSYKSLEDQGIMLPVSHFSVNYKKAALYDDLLEVTTKISEIRGAKIIFHYEIKNENQEVVCTAETTLVFVNKANMRPIAAPDHFLALIATYKTND